MIRMQNGEREAERPGERATDPGQGLGASTLPCPSLLHSARLTHQCDSWWDALLPDRAGEAFLS